MDTTSKSRLIPGAFALALTPLLAPVLAQGHPMAALLIRDFFSGLCHQNPARSFMLHGIPVAVCVRCLGIYLGVAMGLLFQCRAATATRGFVLALLLNLADVATAIAGWHGNWELSRFLLGLLLGVSVGALFAHANLPGRRPVLR